MYCSPDMISVRGERASLTAQSISISCHVGRTLEAFQLALKTTLIACSCSMILSSIFCIEPSCVYTAERNEKRTENGTRFIVMNNVIMIIMGVVMFIERKLFNAMNFN